jgi:hypothetical protein
MLDLDDLRPPLAARIGRGIGLTIMPKCSGIPEPDTDRLEVERCAPRLDTPHQSIKPEPHAGADQRPPYDDRGVDLSL